MFTNSQNFSLIHVLKCVCQFSKVWGLLNFSLLISNLTVRECGLYDLNSLNFVEILLYGLCLIHFYKCSMCWKECVFRILHMSTRSSLLIVFFKSSKLLTDLLSIWSINFERDVWKCPSVILDVIIVLIVLTISF